MSAHSHQHGGLPERTFARLGVAPRAVTDFSANISPLGVPARVREIWHDLYAQNETYPSMDGQGIRQYYQARFGVSIDHVLAGNGAIDLIYAVPQILGIKHVMVPCPAFYDYAQACRVCGATVEDGSLESFVDSKCDALFLGNPVNPSGQLTAAADLLRIAEAFPDRWLLIDEAFIQFVDEPERYSLLRPDRLRDNIVVFHSLTKTYALPGLRLGACVSTTSTIARLAQKRPPWMVSRIAERVAEVLIDCQDYEQQLHALIRSERQRVYAALQQHPRLRPRLGAANFLLVEWTGSDQLDDLLRPLLEFGVHVRDCRNYQGLSGEWFRVAIRRPEENEILLQALASC